MTLDDTDVYTMHRLGQLALKMNALEVADYAFEKCLKRNPNHRPAADGILQILCQDHNIMGAYGWALKWYLKDQRNERALDVLIEITENFPDLIPFYETIWKTPFKRPKDYIKSSIKSVFPTSNVIRCESPCFVKPNDIDQFRQKDLNWLSVGRYIISLYKHLKTTKQSLIFIISVDDFIQREGSTDNKSTAAATQDALPLTADNSSGPPSNLSNYQEDVQMAENDMNPSCMLEGETYPIFASPAVENIKTPQHNDSNTEDSDTNAKQETESNKPKPRRRCSDLSFLEQWGWHKNRRYSSRKKSQQDRPEVDTTLKGFFRRILSKYLE